MKQIAYSKQSVKTLRKMDVKQAKIIRDKIEAYAANPSAVANNVKKLQGSEFIRLRVGDWRVIMDEQGTILMIIKIASRGAAY